MANDILSNGRLQENTVVQRTRNDRGKRGIVTSIVSLRKCQVNVCGTGDRDWFLLYDWFLWWCCAPRRGQISLLFIESKARTSFFRHFSPFALLCAAPDIAAIESRNWLLHRHYTRHEYSACKLLIEQELTKSNGHEYANYLKVRLCACLLIQLDRKSKIERIDTNDRQ